MAAQQIKSSQDDAGGEEQTFKEELEVLENEARDFRIASEGVLTLLAHYLNRRSYVQWAYKTLNQEDLAKNLLNPHTYQNTRKAHKHTPLLIKEKGKWSMTKEEVKRRTHSLAVAGVVHRRIKNTQTNLKLQSAVRSYGLDQERAQHLFDSAGKFISENPREDINSHIIKESTRLHLIQQGLVQEEAIKDDKSLKKEVKKQSKDKKRELKTLEENTKEEYKTTYQKAREANKEALERAETVISQTLDPQSKTPTYQQTKQNVDFIKEAIVDMPEEAAETIEGPQDHLEQPEQKATLHEEEKNQIEEDLSRPSQPTPQDHPRAPEKDSYTKYPQQEKSLGPEARQQPPTTNVLGKTKKPQKASLPATRKTAPISNYFKKRLIPFRTKLPSVSLPRPPSGIIRRPSSGFGGLFSSVKTKLGGLFSRSGSLVKNTLLKTGVKQAIASVIPGVGNAAVLALDAINKLTKAVFGVDFFNAKTIAIVVVLIVLIPVLLISLGLVGLSKIIPNYSSNNAMIISQNTNPVAAWSKFETKYLVAPQKDPPFASDWRSFERKLKTAHKKDR